MKARVQQYCTGNDHDQLKQSPAGFGLTKARGKDEATKNVTETI